MVKEATFTARGADRVVAAAPASGISDAPRRPADALRDALLDSRQRWRDLVALAADLAFETDAEGRLVLVAPDPALGWPAAALLGRPGAFLLAESGALGGFTPFRVTAAVRKRRAWLRQRDGTVVCFSFAAAPLLDAAGAIIGCRGLGQDVSEQERRDTEVAATLRRGQVIDQILDRMRTEVLAPRMMEAVLEPLTRATGSEGVAVLDLVGDGIDPRAMHIFGRLDPAITTVAAAALADAEDRPVHATAPDGRGVLACPSQTRFGEQIAVVLWREPGARRWDGDDCALVSSAGAIIRMILEHEAIQREMARQARTDPLTGLLNRRAFMDELARHLDRLERDGLPGALLFIDLDNFKLLNDAAGHEIGDEALQLVAQLLRAQTRPTDLVARLGGDEFAVWLDGADEFAAAERAERLRAAAPPALAHLVPATGEPLTMSIGIAGHWPGRGEDIETVVHRADQAMYSVKRTGRGHWRVSHEGDEP